MARKLEVEIIGDASKLHKELGKATDTTSGFGKGLGKLGKAAALSAGAAGVGALVGVLKSSVDAFAESEKIGAQTKAVIKSTGGAAHVSAKQIGDLAGAISKKSGIDDEAIQSGANLLLTFTNIRNETGKGNKIFNQATQTITDMSVALGQDMKSSAIQLGKALNDPVKGITALQRVGVSFDESTKEQIKTLTGMGNAIDNLKLAGVALTTKQKDTIKINGDLGNAFEAAKDAGIHLTDGQKKMIQAMQDGTGRIEAQKIILGELSKEFGGSAAAAGDTYAGKMQKLKVAVGNLQEELGARLAPILGTIATAMTRFLEQLQTGEGAGGKFLKTIKDIGTTFNDIWGAMRPIVEAVLPGLLRQLKGFGESIHGVLMVIKGIFRGDWNTIWDGVKEIFRGAIDNLKGKLEVAAVPFKAAGRALGNAIIDGIRGLLEPFKDTGGWITNRIAEGIKGVTEGLTSAASWIRAHVVEFVHNEVAGFSNLGGWVVGRFVDGIKASTKAISDAAGWLKDQVVNAVKKFFGISSPAKVMIELGGHISAGLIKGIVGKDVPGFIGRHFGGISKLAGRLLSSGWEGLKDFFGAKAQPGTPGVGGPISHGLVAQVVNALAWARSHGWHGTVTSGFRTYAEQAALYARYLAGGPLAARPGTSSHESGQAVDVTDPAGFAKALAGAPSNAKIYNRLGAADPVHFSVSGYAMGTRGALPGLAVVGERGPELVNFRGGESVTPIAGGQVIVEHHYHGPVIQDKAFLNYARSAERGFARQNGKPALGV